MADAQVFAGSGRLARYANLVKLPHTVFALPFAVVGVILGTREVPVTVSVVVWVIVAFTAARFAAMGFNRIADRRWDALNPRTSSREIPAGAISVAAASSAVAVASAVFVIAAWQINPLCLALSPVALVWILFYSYTKRFTRWSHVVLGLSLAISPVGGYLAVTGRWSDPWWMLCALAAAVAMWVAGFDVLYALQDVGFDRRHGLHSLPARFGERPAVVAAAAMHAMTVALLAAAGIGAGAGTLYWVGVAAVAALLVYEHSLVRPHDLSRLDAAFFTMNGAISITFSVFVAADRLIA